MGLRQHRSEAVPPLPVFGGEFYIDLAQPWFSVGIPLGGILDVAGQGSADLRLGTLASLRGQTLVMQALVIDDDAPPHLAFTAGLRLRVGDRRRVRSGAIVLRPRV